MKPKKKHGTPIYGPRYVDADGVAKTWSPFYGRYGPPAASM